MSYIMTIPMLFGDGTVYYKEVFIEDRHQQSEFIDLPPPKLLSNAEMKTICYAIANGLPCPIL